MNEYKVIDPEFYVYAEKGDVKCPSDYVIVNTNEKGATDISAFFSQGGVEVVRVGDTIIIPQRKICVHIIGEGKNE